MQRHDFPIITVGGLLQDEAGNALLVKTRKWSNLWGIPGGKVEYGETLEAAFTREVLEETGLHVLSPERVMVQDAIEHPEFHQPRHFVLINYLANVAGTRPAVQLNDEAQHYLWTPLPEALNKPLNGPTRMLLEKVIRRGGQPKDVLSIRDLKVTCIVGVHAHERKHEQDLFLDADLWFDFGRAEASDHLGDTVDYTGVAGDLTDFIRAEKFQLIEALAHRACERLLRLQPVVQRCRLSIRKPGAVLNASCAAVTVDRERIK